MTVNNLPFTIPDKELGLNLALLLMIIKNLGKSKRGKLLINNDKAHVFLYLIKNPVILNKVLHYYNKPIAKLSYSESFSIASISPDFEPLFDRNSLKSLLIILTSKKLIDVSYRNKEGFFYTISDLGESMAAQLKSDYFKTVMKYIDRLQEIQTESGSKLNLAINVTFKNGVL